MRPLTHLITAHDRRGAPVVVGLCAAVFAFHSAAPTQKKGKSERWPFGIAANAADPLAAFAKRDLFNLGLIGAKAWDADRKEPDATPRSGRRQVQGNGGRNDDAGPRRLVIRALLGGGPGQKAGLRLDDVVTGVDQDSFAKGCFAPLAAALRRAEAGSGELVLAVERGGAKLDLKVKIPKGGKDAADPVTGKFRDKILKSSLAWLAERQSGDGGFPATLGANNGQVVNTCLAGLAWIAGGSSQRGGRHRSNLQKAVSFVRRGLYAKDAMAGLGTTDNWDQTTWAFAHAAIFFGELQLTGKDRKLQPFLQQVTDELCRRQEVSGGYAHGPGGKNALGYVELNILGGFVLSGLGLARQAGCKVDDKVTANLLAYLQASGSDDGGVGYSTAAGQKGRGNIGRTAAAWLGCVGLGLGQQPWAGKMRSYVRAHVTDVQDGHASLMQHILLAGVAAPALGDDAKQAYWKAMLRDFTLARCPDGSFQPRPWHETLLMSSNTDVSMGEVWTTASWAIVLGADAAKGKKGGLPGWLGLRVQ